MILMYNCLFCKVKSGLKIEMVLLMTLLNVYCLFSRYITGATTIAAGLSYIISKDTYKYLKKSAGK